jgi:hypothetical protein
MAIEPGSSRRAAPASGAEGKRAPRRPGGKSPRLTIARLGIAASTVVAFVGVLELTAVLGLVDYRLAVPRPDLGAFTEALKDPRNRLDGELIHIHRPYLQIAGSGPGDLVRAFGAPTEREYPFEARYDRDGFRNDRDFERAAVAVIGDSFVEAITVPQPALLSSQLSRLLDVEVVNLGQGRYGPQQELVVLRRFALPRQPRVVLWLFFEGNDLWDARMYERVIYRGGPAALPSTGTADRSFIANVVASLREFATPKPTRLSDEARRRACVLPQGPGGEAETLYLDYAGALSDEDAAALGLVQDIFLEARNLAAANGAQFLLVYVPVKFRVYRDLCESAADGYAGVWQLSDLPARLQSWSERHAVPFLDLTPALREAAADGTLVFFPDDTHWNATGNAVAAEAVATAIERRKWLR